MSAAGLTPRQAECLTFIEANLMLRNVPPSIEETRQYLGAKSKASVHALIDRLVARGYLKRGRSKTARTISLVAERVRCPNCGHSLALGVHQ